MRDKVFIIIGILSLIVMGLDMLGTISETYGMIGYLGMMMFFFTLLLLHYQKRNENTYNPLICIV